jgi:hypothetical protein
MSQTNKTSHQSGPTRRDLLRSGALAGAAAATGALTGAGALGAAAAADPGQGNGPGGSPAGNLILTNGQIHTMDAQDSVVSVIGIRDGEIVYTGDKENKARQEFADDPRRIDLRGATAIPGWATGPGTTRRWRTRTRSPTCRRRSG